jgi:hypothetical protein
MAASAAVVTALKLWLSRPKTELRWVMRRRTVTSVASVRAASGRPDDFHVHFGAVFAPVPPDEALRFDVCGRNFAAAGDVRHAQVPERHVEEFIAVVAVMLGGGIVDFEDGQRLKVKDPHGMGIALKQEAVLLFAAAQIFLGRFAPRAFACLGNGTPDGRRQAVAFLFENIIGGAGLEAFDGRLLADGAGHQDERQIGKILADELERFEAVVIGEFVIREYQVPRPFVQRLNEIRLVNDVAHVRRQLIIGKLVAHQQCIGWIVLEMQYLQWRMHGLVSIRDFVQTISLKQPSPASKVKDGQRGAHQKVCHRVFVRDFWGGMGFTVGSEFETSSELDPANTNRKRNASGFFFDQAGGRVCIVAVAGTAFAGAGREEVSGAKGTGVFQPKLGQRAVSVD